MTALINNYNYRQIFEGFYLQQIMDKNMRDKLFRQLRMEGHAFRFYKWEIIGSQAALGYFDYFTYYPDRVDVQQGFIEKSLKDIYNPFGKGFAAVTQNYSAWTSGGVTSSWTIPTDWNKSDNYMDVIAGGGGGHGYGNTSGAGYGHGGGGAGYARKRNVDVTKGSTIKIYTATNSDSSGSWVNITGTSAAPGSSAQGVLATSGYEGANDTNTGNGSGGTGVYGDILYTGGHGADGNINNKGGGGGGAAGPYGNGANGGIGDSTSASGGGGNGGGSAGSTSGGDNKDGYGGGAYSSTTDGESGSFGGGGGGTTVNHDGGAGGAGTEYNNGSWGSGGGAGGGNSGGVAGVYGGGGAGKCGYGGNSSPAASGLVIISYKTSSNFIVGRSGLIF